MKSEDDILRRLKRRLMSARASVMLEFAFVVPLAMTMFVFAADFTRILRTEQQLEIATRLAADVESHMANYYGDPSTNKCPCSATKNVAKGYLVDFAHVVKGTGKVYIKGDCMAVSNPLTFVLTWVAKTMSGNPPGAEKNMFLKMVAKIFGKLMDFITFGTFNYLTDVVPHDRQVKITTAAYIPTILPIEAYSFFSLPKRGGGGNGDIGVGQFAYDLEGGSVTTAWNLTVNPKRRHRVYCYMPVIDSVPIAPMTYIRVFKSWCAKQKFLKGLLE